MKRQVQVQLRLQRTPSATPLLPRFCTSARRLRGAVIHQSQPMHKQTTTYLPTENSIFTGTQPFLSQPPPPHRSIGKKPKLSRRSILTLLIAFEKRIRLFWSSWLLLASLNRSIDRCAGRNQCVSKRSLVSSVSPLNLHLPSSHQVPPNPPSVSTSSFPLAPTQIRHLATLVPHNIFPVIQCPEVQHSPYRERQLTHHHHSCRTEQLGWDRCQELDTG